MKKYLLIPATALFVLAATPAIASHHSQSDPYCPNDATYTVYSSENDETSQANAIDISAEGFFVALFIAIVIAAFMTATSSSSGSRNLPKELQPSESAEHYDQEALRARAFARKLDADASLADSQLRASLKQDELKEFESFLRDKNARGRRK